MVQYENRCSTFCNEYVSNALAGLIRVSLTAKVQSEDLMARHQALKVSEDILQLGANTGVCLVVFRQIADWAAAGGGVPQLAGGGFLLEFAELSGNPASTAEIGRVRQKVKKKHVCQVGTNGVTKNGGAGFALLTEYLDAIALGGIDPLPPLLVAGSVGRETTFVAFDFCDVRSDPPERCAINRVGRDAVIRGGGDFTDQVAHG